MNITTSKYSKALTIALIVIIVGILGTVAYFGYSTFSEKKKKDQYTADANEFEKMILSGSSGKIEKGNTSLNAINGTSSDKKTKDYIDGYEKKGVIEIPKTGLKCTILGETTKHSLEIAITIMYPKDSDLNVPGTNVVLYGHNYRNSLFFSKNEELEKGDPIYILDQTGKRVRYEVFDKFDATMTDTTSYTPSEEIGDKCEITLSTCTDDADTTDRRTIVRAREV